jgi:hypothetical protein
MNPSTGHLIKLREGEPIPPGYAYVPEDMVKAAAAKLAGQAEAVVSLTSGGKLSKWAAQKRKERRRAAKESRRRNRG